MLKITALSNGIDIAGISFPNNSLSFEISSGTIINIYLVVNKKKIFSSHYLDFLDSSDQQYVSPQAVINDLLVNNSTSGGGGGGGTASDISFVPNGDISSNNVQNAIVEVRDDIDAKLNDFQPSVQSNIAVSAIDWNFSHLYKTLSENTTFTFSNVADAKTIIVALTNTASN